MRSHGSPPGRPDRFAGPLFALPPVTVLALVANWPFLAVVLLGACGIVIALWWRSRPRGGSIGPESIARAIPLDAAGIDAALALSPPSLPPPRSPPVVAPLERPVAAPTPPRLSRAELRRRLEAIDWFQFEKLMAVVFEREGYQVDRRGGAHADDGIDLILTRGGRRVGVQCKHWKAWKVAPKTVREMLGAITAARLDEGWILTLRGFTTEGRSKGAEYGIQLLAEREILDLLERRQAGADPDLLQCLDERRKTCPKCEAPMVERIARQGPQAGTTFWGCSRFPRCDGTL